MMISIFFLINLILMCKKMTEYTIGSMFSYTLNPISVQLLHNEKFCTMEL